MTIDEVKNQSSERQSHASEDLLMDAPLCPNCGAPKTGRYCYRCGQNDKDYSRSTFRVVLDFFHELLELDSRAARTLRVMFVRPGFLALEFAKNRRANYITPIRLYLFSSIVCFFILSVQTQIPGQNRDRLIREAEIVSVASEEVRDRYQTEISLIEEVAGADYVPLAVRIFERDDISQTRTQLDQMLGYLMSTSSNQVTTMEKMHLRSLLTILSTTEDQIQSIEEFEDRDVSVRAYLERLEDTVGADSETYDLAEFILLRRGGDVAKEIFRSSYEEIFEDDVATRFERFVLKGMIHVLAAPRSAIDDFVDNLPIAMFLLLPAMTLVHKLWYIGRGVALAQHLVFSIHLHVIAFIVLAIMLLLPVSEDEESLLSFITGQISLVLFIGLLIHGFIAFRTFYQQSRFVTFLKFCSLGGMYLILLLPSIFLVGLYTAVTF